MEKMGGWVWLLFCVAIFRIRVHTVLPVRACNASGVNKMSKVAAIQAAFESGDAEALEDLIHDDYQFIPHVGGMVMGKSDMIAISGSGGVTMENHRILFENDEIGIEHGIAHFANGSTSEAVLTFNRFEDGKLILSETGATPISDDYQLIGQD